jgi:glycosyltransferase involved in cell wall biosynthesis
MTDISIITPIYNCSSNIINLVSALQSQDIDRTTEIIVVDNNSTDNSFEIAQQFSHIFNITVVNQSQIQSVAATRNKGIELATGDILAFIDGDCIPEPDWLRQGIQCMEENKVERVGGRINIRPLSSNSSTYSLIEALFCYDQESAVNSVGACMTPNLFVKHHVFNTVSKFNQNYAEWEDIEFGMRATRLGSTVAYADKAIVWHPPRQTFREMWHKSKRNGKGTFILCQQNPQWAGKYGWKHPLRTIKIMISLRKPNWNLLPFPYQQISLAQKIKIYLMSWIVINIGEAYGYLREWIKLS